MTITIQDRLPTKENGIIGLLRHFCADKMKMAHGDPNVPTESLARIVRKTMAALETPSFAEAAAEDTALAHLRLQTLNHLQHVSFDFRTDNNTYPHQHVLNGRYPYEPTFKALEKALEFLMIVGTDDCAASSPPYTTHFCLQRGRRVATSA